MDVDTTIVGAVGLFVTTKSGYREGVPLIGRLTEFHVGLLLIECVGSFVGNEDGLVIGLPDGERPLGLFDSFIIDGCLLLGRNRVGVTLEDRGACVAGFCDCTNGLMIGLPKVGFLVGTRFV